MLQTGFARTDITPFLGESLAGYFHFRAAEGVLDPLLATVVAFDDSERRALLISIDNIGMSQQYCDELRNAVGKAACCPAEGVFLACTHTHLGPEVTNTRVEVECDEYKAYLLHRLTDASVMAVRDLTPTEMYYTHSEVKDVAFIRRFRMKDGTVRTNPGWQNPEIDHPIGSPDEDASLLILKREGKPEIGLVHFQVHPDVIGGNLISADYPAFVRNTYEQMIENSRCIYINGAQGDTNHIDVRLCRSNLSRGYERAAYMGEKIALSLIANYSQAQKLEGSRVGFGQKNIFVGYNKEKCPENIAEAQRIYKRYLETGSEALAVPEFSGMSMMCTTKVAEAERIVTLMDLPDEKELYLTALRVGEWALAGFPGEPFTAIGRAVKQGSPFALTMTACCANGEEGYFPTEDCFEDYCYETATANYEKETSTRIVAGTLELLQSLK